MEQHSHHHVLIINSYHSEFQWTRDQVDGFVEEIKEKYPDTQFFSEFLDAKRIESTVYHRSFARMLYDKYRETDFTAVYATDDIALAFAQSFSSRVWNESTPLLASGINNPTLLDTTLHPNTRGVLEKEGGAKAASVILKLNPQARQIVIIADNTEVGRDIGDAVEESVREVTKLPIVRTPPAPWADTLDYISKFDSNTIFLLALYTVDSKSTYIDPERVTKGITRHAAGPVYTFHNIFMNNPDMIGGFINNGFDQGITAGKLALMVLDGTPLPEIPTRVRCEPVCVFNYAAMQKFGISESQLPEGSVIIGKPANLFRDNIHVFLAILIGLLAQSFLIIFLLLNIRKRHAITAALRKSEAQSRMLLENSPLAISISDSAGNIIFLNKKYKELTGYDIPELINLDNLKKIILPDAAYRAEILAKIAEGERIAAIRGTTPDPVEYVATVKDGRNIEVEMYHAEAEGLKFRIINDISERRRVIRELKLATRKAKAASEAKSRFLANVSHEIRTPMNGVLGMVQLLQETHISEDQRDYIDTIRDSCNMLLTVINDILDLSKIEADQVALEPEAVSLRSFINSVAGIACPTIENKGLEFICDASDTLPDTVRCDPNRLKQVLINLLVNASKFTDKGHVELHVRGSGNPGERCRIHFDVADTGIGISEEDQKRIFEPFIQADTSHTRRHGGTGLGLSICQRLVRMMGGDISLRSTVGHGSTFSFDIEVDVLEPINTARPERERINTSTSTEYPLRILIAEDNFVNQKVVKMMLAKMGYKADIAPNGSIAVQMATNNNYDLILMDVQMPVLDGLEATREIRARLRGGDSPHIIALTAHALGDDAQKCISAGMNGHLTKPVKAALLRDALVETYRDRMEEDLAGGDADDISNYLRRQKDPPDA